jgi:hypothetical protein
MSRLHICNTFFEEELATSKRQNLKEWLRSHPAILQLQYLPLLYAAPDDLILVSDLPSNPDPRLHLLDDPTLEGEIEDWGASLTIKNWAISRGLKYEIPDWDVVREINSKAFSFTESPKLPNAQLLKTHDEVRAWIETTPGPKVLKTLFGTAGRGHFHVGSPRKTNELPLIGEPWVDRLFDFSTQWKDGELLGVTVFENEPNGTYKETRTGNPEDLFGPYFWALEEHLFHARPILKKIQEKGFFGHLGIDAYVYRLGDKLHLQPIVEINGRKTMSWAALKLNKKHFRYERACDGALPSVLLLNNKQIRFSRNLKYS